MKIYTFLLVVLMATLFALDANGQNVTINVENVEIKEVFTEIENLTEFNFFYNNSLIDVSKKVSLNVNNIDLSIILVDLFKKTDIGYRLLKNQIVLFPKNDTSITKVLDELIKNESSENEFETLINSALQNEIKGAVTDQNGASIPGVNILLQGTLKGTQSDFDGNFSIQAAKEDVLEFSFLGMKSQMVTVENSNTLSVIMEEDAESLDEVVVTAFGIKREKKSVTYAAQNLKMNALKSARALNITSSLTGKIAGISVTQGANGVGSATSVVLRGYKSISGSSQPLYVVDGVPLGQAISNNDLDVRETTPPGDINNLSPDDVESITVLRGPNAAALYGNLANNGAIIITTKSGNGKEGTTVSVNTSFMTSSPQLLWDYQDEYAQGIDGIYSSSSATSWGPKMTGQSVAHWSNDPNFATSTYNLTAQPNNVKDFYQTGYNLSTNIGIATTKENGRSYFSYTLTDAEGTVPNNALSRHNLNVRVTQKVLNKLTLDAKANYIRSNYINRIAGGESFANPNRHALRLPRNIRTADISQFQFLAADGTIDQHYFKPGDNGGANPHWTINKNNNSILDERVIGHISLKYEFTDYLSLLVRSGLDRSSYYQEDRWNNDSYIIAQSGKFVINTQVRSEWNTDALLNFNKQLNEDFNLDLSIGANHRKQLAQGNRVGAGQNTGLNLENIFALSNIAAPEVTEVFLQKEVQSAFAFAQLGYKDYLFLDASYRNDWSSTLPASNRSFGYASFGLTAILSDILELPEAINFAKIRANYAEVGGDTDPYRLSRSLALLPGGSGGILDPSTTLPVTNLLPESTTSTELGLDLRFLNNRLGFNFTYYKSNSTNQLFDTPLPVGSGVSSVFQNGGDIQNQGTEIVLISIPIKTDNFSWDVAVNFSKNSSKVLRVADGFDEISIPFGPVFWGRTVAKVGLPFGEFFSKGFVRDASGNVIVGADGLPKVTAGQTVNIGNFNPDWLGGFYNEFKYKNFNLSFLIDIRQGGVVSSFTEAVLAGDGLLASTLPGRTGGVFGVDIFPGENAVTESGVPNNIQTTAQAVYSSIGGRNAPTGEAFTKDASNARLRELVLGYTLPQNVLDKLPFKSVKFSIVGRNLFFLWNESGQFDPEVFPTTGNNTAGYSSFAPPTSRNIGFNLNFTF